MTGLYMYTGRSCRGAGRTFAGGSDRFAEGYGCLCGIGRIGLGGNGGGVGRDKNQDQGVVLRRCGYSPEGFSL